MEKLGEYLKAAREKKGKTLSEMAEKTRINSSFLQALEDDDYSAIPGEVFVSGFLRSYARELGLSQKDVMTRFRKAAGERAEEKQEQPPAAKVAAPPQKEHAGKKAPSRIVYAGAVVLAVLLAVYFITAQKEEATRTPAAEEVVKEPAKITGESAPVPAEAGIPDEWQAEEEAPAPEEEKVVRLMITATEDSWFHLTADGERTTDAIIKQGESVEFEAHREIILDLGNAGGVDVEFNGEKVGPFGPHGSVRRVLFTPEKAEVVRRPPTPKTIQDESLGVM